MNASSEIYGIERTAMVAEALRLSGQLRLQVRGESMLPTLWSGDLAHIEQCPISEVRCNDIVLAMRDGRLFLHRFLGQAADGFLLRGDAMAKPDPVYANGAFLGRLIPTTRAQRRSPRWARILGTILCHCGMVRRLTLHLHRRARKQLELAPAS